MTATSSGADRRSRSRAVRRTPRWVQREIEVRCTGGARTVPADVYGPLAVCRAWWVLQDGTRTEVFSVTHVRSGYGLTCVASSDGADGHERARRLVEALVADPACWWDWDAPPVYDVRYLHTVERARALIMQHQGQGARAGHLRRGDVVGIVFPPSRLLEDAASLAAREGITIWSPPHLHLSERSHQKPALPSAASQSATAPAGLYALDRAWALRLLERLRVREVRLDELELELDDPLTQRPVRWTVQVRRTG